MTTLTQLRRGSLEKVVSITVIGDGMKNWNRTVTFIREHIPVFLHTFSKREDFEEM
jgi:hypothetical protein